MTVPGDDLSNTSVIGRLLEELSWEGASVRGYRRGGRGRENVLTAEVFLPLGYLPRQAFLGEVFSAAHGADQTRAAVASEIEDAEITLLPDECRLSPSNIVVQPDASVVSRTTYVLVEVKRIRRSSFQPEQLAREYVALLLDAQQRTPLLLVVLGEPPPVRVAGHSERLSLEDAVKSRLDAVSSRMEGVPISPDEMRRRLPDTLAWVTWSEIKQITLRQAQQFTHLDHHLAGTIRRLATSVTTAIDWHT